MQGVWTMAFRGPKASLVKLDAGVRAMADKKPYEIVVENWCDGFSWPDGFDGLKDTDEAKLRVEAGCSGSLRGMDKVFREFVKLAPELDAAYWEDDDSPRSQFNRIVFYSRAGSDNVRATSAEVVRCGEAIGVDGCLVSVEIHVNLGCDGNEYYDPDDVFDDDPPHEAVQQLRAIWKGERKEPYTFEWLGRTWSSDDGKFVLQDIEDEEFLDGEDWLWAYKASEGWITFDLDQQSMVNLLYRDD